MGIKILFTADNHIGISYSSFQKAQQELLNERMESIHTMVEYANKNEINLFVIGGDLFDKTTIQEKKIKEVAEALKKFTGDFVIVIPGNHDFFEMGDNTLWSKFIKHTNSDKIVVLSDYNIFECSVGEHTINLFPAGCRSKHSPENNLKWINHTSKQTDNINIGIAHGNVTGLGIDDADQYFNMTTSELESCGLDLWLLGHIHVPFPTNEVLNDNPRLFMAGTHMPDSWKFKHSGNCWHIEIEENKNVKAKKIKPSEIQIDEKEFSINSASDLNALEQTLNNYNKSKSALRLTLRGRLDEEQSLRLKELLSANENDFLTLEYYNHISRKIDLNLINQHYPNNSLPHTLLKELLEEDTEGIAVQKAYEILEQLSIKQ